MLCKLDSTEYARSFKQNPAEEGDFLWTIFQKQNARLIKQNAPQARFLASILMSSLSY